MTNEQFEQIMEVLKEIKETLQKNQTNQTQTKITVVGNKAQTAVPKGINSKEDFTL